MVNSYYTLGTCIFTVNMTLNIGRCILIIIISNMLVYQSCICCILGSSFKKKTSQKIEKIQKYKQNENLTALPPAY